MMKTLQRGFTLIELLVVIAIIGILAAVVLASLNDARDGGQDASIKQSIGNARSQAELVYNQDGFTYDGVCESANIISLMNAAANNRSETTGINGDGAGDDAASVGTVVQCNDADAGYAIIAPLNITDNVTEPNGWCVDSTGFAGLASTTDDNALRALDDGADITCANP